MIFVTLGTQDAQFNRLIEYVSSAIKSGIIEEEVIIQSGYTKVENSAVLSESFFDDQTYTRYFNESSMIITHGGAGSIFAGLNKKKKMLVIPRRGKFGEHIDDHQLELAKKLEADNYLVTAHDQEEFNSKLMQLKHTDFQQYTCLENLQEEFSNIITNLL